MARIRISTTVDRDRLERARAAFPRPDSELLDRALELLLRHLDAERERRALIEHPYDDDPDVSWEAPPGPDLPYDGDIPDEVRRLASERRARYS